MGTDYSSPVTELSEALVAPVPSSSNCPRAPRRVFHVHRLSRHPLAAASHLHRRQSRSSTRGMDLKAQIAQSELESPAQMAEEDDALSIPASWKEDSFPTEMEEGEEPAPSTGAEPSSEVASEPFPVFRDFMEEVCSSWDRPASAPSVLKQAALFASLEDVDKLGLAGFPPVDSTIAALVKAQPVVGAITLRARTRNAGSRRRT
ncbi:UNVERIFIED_CONTAM: hypothetical protein FKN15_017466 [Acipenser sinensis]